ncbi:MAG: zinc protease [Candidatus Tokpelaia sp. JSC189]|nr:MAG: zinc protease [Candidatus Tokpelaia sp. JSC189]
MSCILKRVMFSTLLVSVFCMILVLGHKTGATKSLQAKQVSAPKAVEKMPLPEIRTVGLAYTFTLANDLQFVVLPSRRSPVVTQMVWYRAGSADEPRGYTGIAHFLEHLMFKGTLRYPAGEFSRFVSRIGGEENAFTSYDYTGYYQSVASVYLEDIMLREADRMENLILSDEVIAPERQVIIEERHMRTDNNPAAMLSEEVRATLYLNSPYRNPVIGWKQEMEKLTREDAIAFYNRLYTPNNAILVIAGDVTPQRVRELAMATYGRVKRRVKTINRVRPQEPVSRTFREVTMRDSRVTKATYQQYWIVPSYHNAKPGEAEALDLLGEILGGGNRSRLYQRLVVEKGMAAVVGSSYQGNAVDDGMFYVYGMPRGEVELEDLRGAVNAEIADIIKNGISESELEQARKRFIKTMIFSLDSPSELAQIYGIALSTGQTIEDVNTWPERLRSLVKVADIKAVAQRYLASEHRSVVSRLLPPTQTENAP